MNICCNTDNIDWTVGFIYDISFVIALFLIFTGWKMTGEMGGLIKMIVGVGFLLVALKIYNITFEEAKKKK